MKQAILITAYKELNGINSIISHFNDNYLFYIHIDKKSIISRDILHELKSKSNIKFISRRFKVNWGGRNHLLAILHLCEEAMKNTDISFIHLISGQDIPAKPIKYFENIFLDQHSDNYLEYFELPAPFWIKDNGGIDRFSYYQLYDLIDAKKNLKLIQDIVYLQKKCGFRRKFKWNFEKLYGGSTWWSLSRTLVTYVLKFTKDNPWFLKNLKYSFCSEEMYFQTVLLNSSYRNQIINNNLRYISWEYRNNSCPAILDESDYSNIIESDKIFIRKVDSAISKILIDLINIKINHS